MSRHQAYPASVLLLGRASRRGRARRLLTLGLVLITAVSGRNVYYDLGGGYPGALVVFVGAALLLLGPAGIFGLVLRHRADVVRRATPLGLHFVGHSVVFKEGGTGLVLGRSIDATGTLALFADGLSWEPYPSVARRGAQRFQIGRSDMESAEVAASPVRALVQLNLRGGAELRFEARRPKDIERALQELDIPPAVQARGWT